MKSPIKKLTLTLIAIATLGATSALAVPQVKMNADSTLTAANYNAKPNGELNWVLDNYDSKAKSADGNWFGTFCIEKNEYFQNNGDHDVVLNDGSVNGGVSGAVNGKDTISVGTAYLYEQFALGSLTGFDYDRSKTGSGSLLQNTIWYLEGEINLSDVGGSTFLDLVDGLFTSPLANFTGSAVKAMNLTRPDGRRGQDQLVYTASVPDTGATLSMLAFGIIGLAAARRRLSFKK